MGFFSFGSDMLYIIKLHFEKNNGEMIVICDNILSDISNNHCMVHFNSKLKHPYIVFLSAAPHWPKKEKRKRHGRNTREKFLKFFFVYQSSISDDIWFT